MTSGYNGWRNRATWCVSLWIGNSPGDEDMIMENVRESAYKALSKDQARRQLADYIKDMIDEMYDDTYNRISNGFSIDLFLSTPDSLDIDYIEIAELYLEDYDDYLADYGHGSQNRRPAPRKPAKRSPAKKPVKSNACKPKGKPAPKRTPAKKPVKKAPARKGSR